MANDIIVKTTVIGVPLHSTMGQHRHCPGISLGQAIANPGQKSP